MEVEAVVSKKCKRFLGYFIKKLGLNMKKSNLMKNPSQKFLSIIINGIKGLSTTNL